MTLSKYGPLKYRRFLFDSVVPHLGKKIEGVRNEDAALPGIPSEWLIPEDAAEGRAILYLHGGAYVEGGLNSHRGIASRIAVSAGCRVLLIAYRLAPENPFPAALDDAVAAYRWLLGQGYEPGKLAIAGDSSGGGLTAASLVFLRDAGDPLPAAGMMLSPWADLELTGESVGSVGWRDPMIRIGAVRKEAAMYAGGRDPRDPLMSPIHAGLRGLPPLCIQVGTCEVLLDDSRRLAKKAKNDGVEVELSECEGMFHVYQFFAPMIPESSEAVARLGEFFREKTSDL